MRKVRIPARVLRYISNARRRAVRSGHRTGRSVLLKPLDGHPWGYDVAFEVMALIKCSRCGSEYPVSTRFFNACRGHK